MRAWLRRIIAAIVAALTTPAPLPEWEQEPKPPALPEDEIDPRSVAWDEPRSPASWPITARITSASFTRDGMTATHTGTERWPVRADGGEKPSIGNWWIIANVDGRLHGSTVEWLGKGKTRVTGKRWDGTDDIHGVLSSWRPVQGEIVGMMLSTVARGAPYTIEERTQIVTVRV